MGAGLLYLLAYMLSLVCDVAPCLLSFGAAVLSFSAVREWERRFSLTIPRLGWYGIRSLHFPCQATVSFLVRGGEPRGMRFALCTYRANYLSLHPCCGGCVIVLRCRLRWC